MESSIKTRKELVLQRTYVEVQERREDTLPSNGAPGHSESYKSSVFEQEFAKYEDGVPVSSDCVRDVHVSGGGVPYRTRSRSEGNLKSRQLKLQSNVEAEEKWNNSAGLGTSDSPVNGKTSPISATSPLRNGSYGYHRRGLSSGSIGPDKLRYLISGAGLSSSNNGDEIGKQIPVSPRDRFFGYENSPTLEHDKAGSFQKSDSTDSGYAGESCGRHGNHSCSDYVHSRCFGSPASVRAAKGRSTGNVSPLNEFKSGGIFDCDSVRSTPNRGRSPASPAALDTGTDLDAVEGPLPVRIVTIGAADRSPQNYTSPESGYDTVTSINDTVEDKVRRLEALLHGKGAPQPSSDAITVEAIIENLPKTKPQKNGSLKSDGHGSVKSYDRRPGQDEPFQYADAEDYSPYFKRKNNDTSKQNGEVSRDIGFVFAEPDDYAPLREQVENEKHQRSDQVDAMTPLQRQKRGVGNKLKYGFGSGIVLVPRQKYRPGELDRGKKNGKEDKSHRGVGKPELFPEKSGLEKVLSDSDEVITDEKLLQPDAKVEGIAGAGMKGMKLDMFRKEERLDGNSKKGMKEDKSTNLFFDTMVFLGDCFLCHGERP